MKRLVRRAWLLGVAGLVLGAQAWAISPKALEEGIPTLAPMLKEVTPAVVSIRVQKPRAVPTQFGSGRERIPEELRRFFDSVPNQGGGQRQPFVQGSGSGVIIDADKGLIVSNHHVVAGASEITVVLNEGSEVQATLVGSDERTDVALLEIAPGGLAEIGFADIESVEIGDYVLAIGNPFGIGQTVTSGIVSALGRAGLNNANYEDFIQTDAAINVGNSGGALVDLEGNLVGINTAIISGNGGSNGIGFAIPVNMIQSVVNHIARDGEVRRGLLGITMRNLDSQLAQTLDLEVTKGVLITQVVAGSSADQAGLRVSDVVTQINGKAVDDSREIRNIVGLMRLGEELQLTLLREGKEMSVQAYIGENPAVATTRPVTAPAYAGARFRSAQSPDGGVEVVAVQDSSAAWNAGLRPGDRVVEVNRRPVADLQEFNTLISEVDDLSALTVLREGRELLVFLS